MVGRIVVLVHEDVSTGGSGKREEAAGPVEGGVFTSRVTLAVLFTRLEPVLLVAGDHCSYTSDGPAACVYATCYQGTCTSVGFLEQEKCS